MRLEFVNEYSLVVESNDRRGGRPRFHVFDTKQGTDMKPTQTTFYLSSAHDAHRFLYFTTEPCGHVPSPDELMTAPFYSDPDQRILALRYKEPDECFVINVELLLELAREREGQGVMWDEWAAHTVEVQVGELDLLDHIWVSGCRLYCTVSNEENDAESYLRIYDFSYAGRFKHLRTLDGTSGGRGSGQISQTSDGYKLPWHPGDFYYVTPVKGHDSIVFCVVSLFIFLSIDS